MKRTNLYKKKWKRRIMGATVYIIYEIRDQEKRDWSYGGKINQHRHDFTFRTFLESISNYTPGRCSYFKTISNSTRFVNIKDVLNAGEMIIEEESHWDEPGWKEFSKKHKVIEHRRKLSDILIKVDLYRYKLPLQHVIENVDGIVLEDVYSEIVKNYKNCLLSFERKMTLHDWEKLNSDVDVLLVDKVNVRKQGYYYYYKMKAMDRYQDFFTKIKELNNEYCDCRLIYCVTY
jgi:hypothetical protein